MDYKKLQKLSLLSRDIMLNEQPGVRLEKFSDRLGSIEQDPFIGFIGSDYEQTQCRVLFLGKSNAQSAPEHNIIDRQINASLQSFKNADENLENFYRLYANNYLEAMPRWNISRFVNEFRNLTGLSLNQVAYANIVPYRYIDAPNNAAYKASFQEFTNPLIEIIQPNLIIPLGATLKDVIEKYLISARDILVSQGINREGRDKRIAEAGWQTIFNAVEDYEEIRRKA